MKLDENFNQQEFTDWIEEFLPDFSRDIRKVDVPGGFTDVKSINTLGESGLSVRVYIIETDADPSKRKVGLATDSFNLLRNYGSPNAIIAYYSKDAPLWRISLLTSTPIWSEGKIITKLSNPKRQSYVLGSKAKIKTPYQYLLSKGKIIDFTDLKSRFSLEVVNKEFYKEISQAFTRLVGGTVTNGKSKKTVEALLKLPSLQDRSQTNLEFAVRLIGRIIFCWFLREKRSETGHSLIPKELVSFDAVNTTQDYYHKILEPIFFEILNKPVRSRKENFINDLFSAIPYLNGGLFSPHEDDSFSYNEGKQAINHNTLIVPDEWLKSFFEVLETYNFTIDENTSFDEELSIDPEMLGRIFENLLAEINPETGESARKSTGSYYTPRIIVDYMIDESLLLYLKEKTGVEENKLRSLISYDLEDDKSNPLNEDEKDKIIQSLGTIKILDPACGSGAFPIGALQKIVFILQQIDQNGQLWFKKQIQNTPIELRNVLEREFQQKNFDYIRKLGIIRENIYGIDIQPIATEISRLRCFLTLVVDERIDDSLENRGIEPLPNLDFKFVTANSLIGLPKIKLDQQELFDDNVKIEQLKSLRDQYFTARNEERKDIMIAFSELQSEMINELIDVHSFIGVTKAELTRKLTDWKPFKHKSTDWFDPEWMFGINKGFDIVISNPPYISTEKVKEPEKSNYKNQYKDIHVSRIDIYCYFYSRGLNLAKEDSGFLFYITSNKWMRAGYGDKTRGFFTTNNPIQLIDFSGLKVFEGATVDTSILLIQKARNKNLLEAVHFKSNFRDNQNIRSYFETHKSRVSKISDSTWYIGSSTEQALKEKIEIIGTPLKDWDLRIQMGIRTGLNEAFIIDNATKKMLIAEDSISKDLIKPIIRGRDIKRYGYKQSGLYVLALGYGSYKTLKQNYPAIYNHLVKYESKLKNRGQCRGSRSGKRISKDFDGQHHWLELDNNLNNEYFSEFEKEKIAWIDLADEGRFSKVDPGIYIDKTLFFLTGSQIPYLLGVLNSKIINWYFDTICSSSGVGTNLWSKISIEALYIPKITNDNLEQARSIGNLASQIQEINSVPSITDTKLIEKQIDQLVYKLYELTPEEIAVVEGKGG